MCEPWNKETIHRYPYWESHEGHPLFSQTQQEHETAGELFYIYIIILFIFIFGCAGSLLLRTLSSSFSAWASHYSGFSCFRAWALGHRLNSCGTQAQLLCGMGSSQIRDQTRVSCIWILYHWAIRETQDFSGFLDISIQVPCSSIPSSSILDTSTQSNAWFAHIFSYSVGCLFTFVVVFWITKVLVLKFSLSIFFPMVANVLHAIWKNHCPVQLEGSCFILNTFLSYASEEINKWQTFFHFVLIGFGSDKAVKRENEDRTSSHETSVHPSSKWREEAERKAQATDQGYWKWRLRSTVRNCKISVLLFLCFLMTKVVSNVVINVAQTFRKFNSKTFPETS